MYRKSSGEEQTKIRRGTAKKDSLQLDDKTELLIEKSELLQDLETSVKECPVCHARCFADMEVCYGCLHSFKKDIEKSQEGTRRSSSKRTLPSRVVAKRLSTENGKGVSRLDGEAQASMQGNEEFRSIESSLLNREAQAAGIVQPNEKGHLQETVQPTEKVHSAEKKKVEERIQGVLGSELLEIVISVRAPSGVEVSVCR